MALWSSSSLWSRSSVAGSILDGVIRVGKEKLLMYSMRLIWSWMQVWWGFGCFRIRFAV